MVLERQTEDDCESVMAGWQAFFRGEPLCTDNTQWAVGWNSAKETAREFYTRNKEPVMQSRTAFAALFEAAEVLRIVSENITIKTSWINMRIRTARQTSTLALSYAPADMLEARRSESRGA